MLNGHVMSVWDPNDDDKKTAVFSQIKRLIFALVSGFKGVGGTIHPGVLMPKHVWQWFWGYDWLNNKVKNYLLRTKA